MLGLKVRPYDNTNDQGHTMKNFLTLCAGLLVCSAAIADNHMPAQQTIYGQYYSLVVSDPAAVVDAMQKYRASATGQKMQSSVTLSQNIANGELQGTHAVNVFYPSTEAMDATMRVTSGSADAAAFRQAMQGAATIEAENLFTMLISKINQEDIENPASMLFGLNVTDQAAFMKALNKLLDSSAAANFPGNLFFGQILAMGDTEGTHWVSFQASSVGALITGVDTFMKSSDFAAYAKNADSFREVTSRMVNRQILALQPPTASN